MKKCDKMFPRLRARARELGMNYDDIAEEMNALRRGLVPPMCVEEMTRNKITARFSGRVTWSISEGVLLCDVLKIPRENILDEFFGRPRNAEEWRKAV